MKIAIYILYTFAWHIIWMQSGPALSRCEIGLNALTCIKFVHLNMFHFIFKKRNMRLMWDAKAYRIAAIWLYVYSVNCCWLVVGHIEKQMSIASIKKVLSPTKHHKNMRTTAGSFARDSMAFMRTWNFESGEKKNLPKKEQHHDKMRQRGDDKWWCSIDGCMISITKCLQCDFRTQTVVWGRMPI